MCILVSGHCIHFEVCILKMNNSLTERLNHLLQPETAQAKAKTLKFWVRFYLWVEVEFFEIKEYEKYIKAQIMLRLILSDMKTLDF